MVLYSLFYGLAQRYTNHDIVKYLESIGAEFGACQNAYTSADDTVYEFLVPTDDLQVLENSFDVFAEFATKIRCALSVISFLLLWPCMSACVAIVIDRAPRAAYTRVAS